VMKRAQQEGINPLKAGLGALRNYLSQFSSGAEKMAALESMGFGGKIVANVMEAIQSLGKFGEAHEKIMASAGATEEAYQERVASWTFIYITRRSSSPYLILAQR